MLLQLLLSASVVSALDVFNYGAFTQTATYSVANVLGFFKAYDLDVKYLQVPNSVAAFASLASGEYDLLTATIDNAVNLRFNSGRNFTVLGQLDQGPDLVLASAPNITKVSQLVGKPLIVDSPVSGYAYLLRKMLSANGLVDSDYFFQTVGGTSLRYVDPFTAYGQSLPAAQQPNILARVASYENPITSSAFTISQSSLSNSTKTVLLERFMGAMYAANLYLNDPRNQKCATKAIQTQLNVTSATAKLEYVAATNCTTGEISPPNGKFTVNQQGINNIIAVRKEFGGFTVASGFDFVAATKPGVGKLIDYSVRDKAVKNLKTKLLSCGC